MPRTTIDIDATVLRELKRRQRDENKTLGQLASELLAGALDRRRPPADSPPLKWTSAPMQARIDLDDKDAVHNLLDRE